MQPDAVVCTLLGDQRQRINGATNGGSCRRNHRQAGQTTGLQGCDRIGESLGAEATISVDRQLLQCLGRQPHHGGGLLQRHVGIPAAEDHATVCGGSRAGHHEGHQIAEGPTAGQNPTGLIRQTEAGTEPATELLLKAGQTGGKLLGQKVVVQPGTDELSGNGSGQRRRVQMRQGTRMGRLKGAIHHHLQIAQQLVHAGPQGRGSHRWLRSHQGQRRR